MNEKEEAIVNQISRPKGGSVQGRGGASIEGYKRGKMSEEESEEDIEKISEEEIEEDVEEVLEDSKHKLAEGGWSNSIRDEDDLNRAIEVIKRVYARKPFDLLHWTVIWADEDD